MPSDSPAPLRLRLDFDPARDGFSFRNRFEWNDADLTLLGRRLRPLASLVGGAAAGAGGALAGPVGAVAGATAGASAGATRIGGALVRSVARRWSSFGLCGGMALAAIERWPARGRIETAALPAETLRPLLRRRQETTLRASVPRFAAAWVRARAAGAGDVRLANALALELDRITETLASERPALVGLIGDSPDPFANHQVVVFGIERSGAIEARLDVYDPNAPGQTRWIRSELSARLGAAHLTTSLPTGRQPNGRAHISTRKNGLSHLFEIRV